MKRWAVAIALVACAGAASAKPKKAPAPTVAKHGPAAPAATLTRVPDGTRLDLAVEGTLLGWAAPRAKAGRVLYMLVAAPDPSLDERACRLDESDTPPALRDARLYRWSPEHPDALTLVAKDLPRGTLDAADLDGASADTLLFLREGQVDVVAADGTLHEILREAALGRASGDPRSVRAPNDNALRLTLEGRFTTFRREPGAGVRATSSLELPVRITKGSSFVNVIVPEAVPVGALPGAPPLFATLPEPVGAERLRTRLLQPDKDAPEPSRECWAQLPEPERMLDSGFAVIDGVPSLIVTTMSAEKLNLFGEKRLRVFALTGDRTRSGESPRFAAVTGLNIWQAATPFVVDLDGDRHDDLVLAYWKGLKNSIAALEVYPGRGGGTFGKPRTTDFDVEKGDKAYLAFGRDEDGDGRPDLVVLAGGNALVYPGGAPEASKAVGSRPSRTVPLLPGQPVASETYVGLDLFGGIQISRKAPGMGTPRGLDLDGDGRPELVFAGDLDGAARLSVVAFRGAAALADGAPISYK